MSRYITKNEVISKLLTIRSIHEFNKFLDELSLKIRRLPPSTLNTYQVFMDQIFQSNEIGGKVRVGQLHYITSADIMRLSDKYTYIVDTKIEFGKIKPKSNCGFLANLNLTVSVPDSDLINISVFETYNSSLFKFDKPTNFVKSDGKFYASVDGMRILDDTNSRIKLIFHANDITHLPITILIEYDIISLSKDIYNVIISSMKRRKFVRIDMNTLIAYTDDRNELNTEIIKIESKKHVNAIDDKPAFIETAKYIYPTFTNALDIEINEEIKKYNPLLDCITITGDVKKYFDVAEAHIDTKNKEILQNLIYDMFRRFNYTYTDTFAKTISDCLSIPARKRFEFYFKTFGSRYLKLDNFIKKFTEHMLKSSHNIREIQVSNTVDGFNMSECNIIMHMQPDDTFVKHYNPNTI